MSLLWKIVLDTMNIEEVDIDLLKTNLNKVKHHNKKNIQSIIQSLNKFGQYSPLIVNKSNCEILKGVGTYLAMKKLKWKTCKVCFVDLDDKAQKELIILDNRTSQLSQFDNQVIEKMFYNMDKENIEFTGFNEKQVDNIMNSLSQELLQDQTEKVNLVKIKCPFCGTQFNEES